LTLGDFLWFWLRMSGTRPKFVWDPEPKFYLECGTFGEIGVQIMQAVSNAQGLTICSGCGRAYMRKGRKPQEGRRNYCPECGTRAALKDAQRQRRARKRQTDGETQS
jgi:DNA-directed RNA polymerase subunit RPC12/RpoP